MLRVANDFRPPRKEDKQWKATKKQVLNGTWIYTFGVHSCLYADEIEATIDCYLSNARQLGEGGTCRKLKISTNVRATFAKLLVSRSFFIIHKLKFQICQ